MVGTVDNFLSINCEDLVSHGMPNILSNASHMNKCLMRFRREVRAINLVVDLFPYKSKGEG